MPVIAVAAAKGGAGKSTTTLVLATCLAREANADVCIIDADRNQPLVDWKENNKGSSPVTVIAGEERNLVRTITREASSHQFVFVDVEGSANLSISYAVAKADLVLIPLQPSALEVRKVGQVLDLMAEQEALLGRSIPFRLLFNRTPATSRIVPRLMKEISGAIAEQNLPVFSTWLADRQAYKLIHSDYLALHELNPAEAGNLEAAINNVSALAEEMITYLVEQKNHRVPSDRNPLPHADLEGVSP